MREMIIVSWLLALVGAPGIVYAQERVLSSEDLSYLQRSSRMPGGEDLVRRVKARFLPDRERIIERQGATEVRPFEMIEGDLLVVAGPLKISGAIEGTVVVVNGDLTIRSSARITGNAIAVNGKVTWEAGSSIFGEIIEADLAEGMAEAASPSRPREISIGESHGMREWHGKLPERGQFYRMSRRAGDHDDALVTYDRVQGLFVGLNLPRDFGDHVQGVDLDAFGFLGYGFASKKWRYRLTGELALVADADLALGATVYDLTDTDDEWIISRSENSLAAALVHEDFLDYYRRFGSGIYMRHAISRNLDVQAGYYREFYGSLSNQTDWSLFRQHRDFRTNPSIIPGKSHAFRASVVFDSRRPSGEPHSGWYLEGQAIWSRPGNGGEFDFDRYLLEVRRLLPVGEYENLNLRLRAGSARGLLPAQHYFYLGGISTLRAHGYKDLVGDRLLLANIEYELGRKHRKWSGDWLLGDLNLILFVDSGLAWFAGNVDDARDGFRSLKISRLQTDYGLGLASDGGDFRIDFARSTVAGRRDLTVAFRLNRAF